VAHKIKSLLVGSAAALAFANPASAINIILHDMGGAATVKGTQAERGFQIAAKYWESVLVGNATIELKVGYGGLPANVLGSTGSNQVVYDISSYYGALAAASNSALDAKAVATLQPLNISGGVTALVPAYINAAAKTGIDVAGGTRVAPDGGINSAVVLNTAVAKALGETFAAGTIDGTIQFSNQFAFDFNPTDGISAGTSDFIGVAVHEIGHALGFVSGVDDFDYFNGYTGTVDQYAWAYGLDMFRYTAPGELNWAPNQDAYFSIDGGQTALWNGYFSTGAYTGDQNQASHWKEPNQVTPCDNFLGVMNPYICGGKEDSVTALDLAAFDAIGWNLSLDVLENARYEVLTSDIYNQFAIPEPATLSVAFLGLLAAGTATRRRKQQQG
jgi:hypothetical protein